MRLFTLLLALWCSIVYGQTNHQSDSICLQILTARLDSVGVDIDSLLVRLEDRMIDGKYFKNHSPQNYIDALRQIQEDENIGFGQWAISRTDEEVLNNLNIKFGVLESGVLQVAKTDTNSYIFKRDHIYNEIVAFKDINVGNITGCILKYWVAEDFNSNLYRLTFFKLLLGIYNPSEGLRIHLPDYSDSVRDQKNEHTIVFEIKIDSDDIIYANGNEIKLSKVTDALKIFLSHSIVVDSDDGMEEEPTSLIISFKNQRGTTVEQYVKVYNEIIRAYNEVRNELALDTFGASFKQLDSQQQNEIRKQVPMRISEAEPIDD